MLYFKGISCQLNPPTVFPLWIHSSGLSGNLTKGWFREQRNQIITFPKERASLCDVCYTAAQPSSNSWTVFTEATTSTSCMTKWDANYAPLLKPNMEFLLSCLNLLQIPKLCFNSGIWEVKTTLLEKFQENNSSSPSLAGGCESWYALQTLTDTVNLTGCPLSPATALWWALWLG